MVERAGICMICGGPANPAYTCRLCGAMVCGRCFSVETGLCKRCAAKAGR
ncbi:MAG TPA: orotate phosphoribosyltransferase [Candidatus Aenigmarchaeota archaeon]|nr:orotate phosphoribosyltransferase [Candidatus Aenigmarchaeota archaeon]